MCICTMLTSLYNTLHTCRFDLFFYTTKRFAFKITCYMYSTMENEIQINPDSLLTFFLLHCTLLF